MEILLKIQNELKVPKGNFNSFGKYKYRSAEDILEAVKPILSKHKATVVLSDEVVSIGNKIFVKATAYLYADKEKFEVTGYAETSEHKGMSSEQTTGTASSYARKYALNGLFLIDETEADADNDNVKTEVKPQIDLLRLQTRLKACTTLDELGKTYLSFTAAEKVATETLKNQLKTELK
ncbi:MAG: hypothetical protein RLZZ605_588 [Bacteroidota bacterium]|jgi:hypothetical protein